MSLKVARFDICRDAAIHPQLEEEPTLYRQDRSVEIDPTATLQTTRPGIFRNHSSTRNYANLTVSKVWLGTMRRREFITLIGGAVAAWPLAAVGKAQRIAIVVPTVPMNFLSETGDDPGGFFPAIFRELRRSGYVEGQNLLVERHSGEGRASHYPDLARDVVSRNPDVIIAISNNRPRFQSGNNHYSDCRSVRRSGRGRDRREPGAAGRQYHRALCRRRVRTVG